MTTRLASAVFDTHQEAERAISELRDAGVPENAFSIVAQHDGDSTAAEHDAPVEGRSNVLRGIIGGGALGAGIGVAALAIPGVGPLVAAGAIAASAVPEALAIGAAAGAAGGTLKETLSGHGVGTDDAAYYDEHVGRGGVFVSVDTSSGFLSADQVHDVLFRNGGHSTTRSRAGTY